MSYVKELGRFMTKKNAKLCEKYIKKQNDHFVIKITCIIDRVKCRSWKYVYF